MVHRVGSASGAGTASRKGNALHGNEDPADDRTPPRRTAIRPEGIAAEIRRRRAQQAQQTPSVPDRPRPGAAATTGQLPVARTRATGAGPTGTAPIPVVRVQPAAPAPQDTARRRLRVEPPAAPVQPMTRREALRTAPAAPQQRPAPQPPETRGPAAPPVPEVRAPRVGAAAPRPAAQPVRAPAPAPQPLRPPVPVRTRPASAPSTTASPSRPAARPSSPAPAPRPVVRTVPPPPVAPDVEPAVDRRRRPFRRVLATLAAFGLLGVFALPSIAGETAGAPPVSGVHLDDDLQQFHVGGDVRASGTQTDSMTGQMPVAAAPTWVVPLRGELRDGFGPRLQQPVAGVNLFHRGQDIGGGCGAAIHAAAAGTVESAGWWGTYGNWTLIDHGDGVETGYAHQARMLVRPGQRVAANQVIGYEGTTGASTGCHLHLEVHLNGVAVNPVPFFVAKGIPLGR